MNYSYRLHNKFRFFFFFFFFFVTLFVIMHTILLHARIIVNLFMIILTILLHARIIFFFKVYLRSCIGLGLRAVLFTLISFHSLPRILTLHHADGGVENLSFLSYAPSCACVITFHSSEPSSIKVTCPKHLVVFQGN